MRPLKSKPPHRVGRHKMELPSKQDFEAFLSQRQVRMGNLVSSIQQPQLAKDLANGGSQANLNAIKQEITTINSDMSNYNGRIEHILHTIEREHADISRNVKGAKERTNDILHKLGTTKELAELRKEQADELKTKYGANFHTSYLGLWRPLHPETHAILYTLAIVFGLTSVAAIVFLILTNTSLPAMTYATTTTTPATTTSNSLFEGGAKRFRKK